jgi:hypothetical protein
MYNKASQIIVVKITSSKTSDITCKMVNVTGTSVMVPVEFALVESLFSLSVDAASPVRAKEKIKIRLSDPLVSGIGLVSL